MNASFEWFRFVSNLSQHIKFSDFYVWYKSFNLCHLYFVSDWMQNIGGCQKMRKKCWFRKLAVCYCLLLLSKPCTTGVSDSFEAPIISRISEIHCVNSKKLKFVDFLLNLVVWISLLVKNFTAYLCLVILSVLHEKYWMLITVPINNHQNIII